jgi:hypothetical protein
VIPFFFFFVPLVFSCLRRYADALYRIRATNVITRLRLRSRADRIHKEIKEINQNKSKLHVISHPAHPSVTL